MLTQFTILLSLVFFVYGIEAHCVTNDDCQDKGQVCIAANETHSGECVQPVTLDHHCSDDTQCKLSDTSSSCQSVFNVTEKMCQCIKGFTVHNITGNCYDPCDDMHAVVSYAPNSIYRHHHNPAFICPHKVYGSIIPYLIFGFSGLLMVSFSVYGCVKARVRVINFTDPLDIMMDDRFPVAPPGSSDDVPDALADLPPSYSFVLRSGRLFPRASDVFADR
ncbi:hypothetical protein HDE_04912 [Halotydeus destructor]|nr:hypothetical protein HDE_04912 [Halotydeus destructor]